VCDIGDVAISIGRQFKHDANRFADLDVALSSASLTERERRVCFEQRRSRK